MTVSLGLRNNLLGNKINAFKNSFIKSINWNKIRALLRKTFFY